MKTQFNNSRLFKRWAVSLIVLLLVGGNVNADVSGLNAGALDELRDAGVDKYLGT